jgi:hypothetical protein
MGKVCSLVNANNGSLLAEGYIRRIGRSAVIEVPELETLTSILKPLEKVGVKLEGDTAITFGFIYTTNPKSNIIVVGLGEDEDSENRRTLRVSVNETSQLDVGRGSEMTGTTAVILNLSEGGFAFKSPQTFSIGDVVAYKIDNGLRKTTLCGKIMRVTSVGEDTVYGVKFIHMDIALRTSLNIFVLKCVSESLMSKELEEHLREKDNKDLI